MKDLLAVISLVICASVAEVPAPYPPSGWRPNGRAFELPQRSPAKQGQQSQEYLPPALPVDPRRPKRPNEIEPDVSVQGLPPAQEQLPQFQISPVDGRQYVGPAVNNDIRNLDVQYRQAQTQQQGFQEIDRQRQLYGAPRQASQAPRQFARPSATSATEATTATAVPELRTTTDSLNQGEVVLDDSQSVPAKQRKGPVSVEVSKQNIREYPAELFLNPLAQLSLQAAYPGQQFGQLILQPGLPEKQTASAGYDGPTHFAGLTSILSQRQIAGQTQGVVQNQQAYIQNPIAVPRGQESSAFVLLPQAPETQASLTQYQPLVQAVQPQQYQFQLLQTQPQITQYGPPNQQNPNPESKDTESDDENDEDKTGNQPQFVAQPPQFYQPQEVQYQTQPQVVYQPQAAVQPQFQQPQLGTQPQYTAQAYQPQNVQYQGQPQFSYQPQPAVQPQILAPQPQAYQPQEVQYQGQQPEQPQLQYQPQGYQQNQAPILTYQDLSQYYQNQQQLLLQQQQMQNQGRNALQSGVKTDQGNELNDADDKERSDDEQNSGSKATSVATAFGARTRPRVYTQYGAPAPAQDNNQEEVSEDGPVVAVATAEATPGGRRKSAKLRSRRVRPLFTLDKSGHLVLAQEQ